MLGSGMDIYNGIKLVDPQVGVFPPKYIEFSSGIESINGAYVPVPSWRFPSEPELKLVIGDNELCSPDVVTLIRFQSDFLAKLRSQITPLLLKTEDYVSDGNQRILQSVTLEVSEFLKNIYHIQLSPHRSTDIQLTPGKSPGTAFDFSKKRYVGLHLDNHDRLELSQRRDSFQVLGINLGESIRFLYYLNIPADKMVCALIRSGFQRDYRPEGIKLLTSDFFDTFSDYPICRLSLSPGEAYIATTQYVVHDGAPSLTDDCDIALLISGKFNAA